MKNFGTTELVKTNGSWHEGLLWGQTGGGRGIRTPGTLSGTTVFKTVGINRSPIPPRL